MLDKYIEYIKQGREDKFYKSYYWQAKRKEIIARDNYECQRCKEMGRVGKGEMVHHKKHLRDYPQLGMTDDNLVTLCNTCHNEVHERDLTSYRPNKKKFISEERW